MEKELPKNWVEVELEQLGEDKYYAIGDGDHGQIKPKDYQDNGIPYIRVSDIGWGNFKSEKLVYISEGIHNKNLKSELLPGDILIAKTGATIGKCCIVPEYISKANTTSSVGKVSINKNLTSSKWILYFFLSPEFFKTMWSKSSRTAQPGFNIIHLKKFIIPLPPLSEQNRIVDKLDRLFAQLEVIKSSMEKIPVLLKNFRQQVLTQAVTGKLTEEWRREKELEKWVSITINDICGSIVPGRDKPKSFTGNIPWITTPNLTSKYINKSNANLFLSNEEILEVRAKKIPVNSVIMTIVGKFGISAIIKEECVINQQLHAFLPSQKIIPEFLTYVIDTKVEYLESISSATTIAYINKTKANSLPLNLPSILEQQEIVSRVESLFAKADAIEEKYKNLKAKIETLPQTILHKAFKGELTEQLESDGDARDLLEEIMALKSGDKPKKAVSKKYIQPDDEVLRIVAEESSSYPTLSGREKKVQRKMLATHIINQSLKDQSFGKTKFEKLLHLVEYHVLQRDLNQNYSVQAAGPYDGGFTKTFWDEVLKSKWFALEEKGSLRRIVSGSNQEKSLKDYGYFSNEEKKKIDDFIKIFDHSNYEKPEIVSTLYAVWNNRIIRNEPITNDLLKEDFLNWDSGKARYKDRLDKALEWMKENGIVPNGWGKEIKRAKK